MKMPRKCSICQDEGHISTNRKFHPKDGSSGGESGGSVSRGPKIAKVETEIEDTYTEAVLKEQFNLHKNYVKGRIESSTRLKINFRFPSIPEDISENIVKFIIQNWGGDKTSNWNCGRGDLFSKKEGKQECKCFTSDGPPSFTPSSEWDVIYFLDARGWLQDKFILHRVNLKRTSDECKNIKVSKSQTFDDQCKQTRRPRIVWDSLHPQIAKHCSQVFEGTFEEIFTPPATTE